MLDAAKRFAGELLATFSAWGRDIHRGVTPPRGRADTRARGRARPGRGDPAEVASDAYRRTHTYGFGPPA